MSSPLESHPPVDPTIASCPVTGQTHEFVPATEGDSRSPCPALNALANHGYLPRDGKNIAAWDFVRALQECYGLSTPLATFLSYGTFVILNRYSRMSLSELAKHNAIEHDASIVHADTPEGQEMAPINVVPALVEALIRDVKPSAEDVEAKKLKGEDARFLMGIEDVARTRIRREGECRPLPWIRQRAARGEMSLALGVFSTTVGDKTGIPVELLCNWIQNERLPEDWKPRRVEGILDFFRRNQEILGYVNRLRAAEEEARKQN